MSAQRGGHRVGIAFPNAPHHCNPPDKRNEQHWLVWRCNCGLAWRLEVYPFLILFARTHWYRYPDLDQQGKPFAGPVGPAGDSGAAADPGTAPRGRPGYIDSILGMAKDDDA